MADQDRNSGSKQTDSKDGGMKAKPTDKEAQGATGGRTASGVGSPARGDGSATKPKSTGTESGGYTAGSKNKSEESVHGKDLSGKSGSGKSGSTNR